MASIRGFFSDLGPHPRVSLRLRTPAVSAEWQWLTAIIDTGAVHTCLHARDARELFGIEDIDSGPLAQGGTYSDLQGVGAIVRYRTTVARLAFEGDEGGSTDLNIVLRVATRGSELLPSLLGMDVLQHFRLEVDGPGRTVALHRD